MRQLRIQKTFTPHGETISLDKYLQEIGRDELISAEEEIDLAQRIKKGDRSALEKLAKANLRFVVSVAKRYQGQGVPLPDLINAGNIGLIKAAKKFDETRGFKFISYAVWHIRREIQLELARYSKTVPPPFKTQSLSGKINRYVSRFEAENGFSPRIPEISDFLKKSIDEIVEAMNVKRGDHISFDLPFSKDPDSNCLYDVTPSNEHPTDHLALKGALKGELSRYLNMLPEMEKDIIKHYFEFDGYLKLDFAELAEKFSMSETNVRRIKEKGLKRLRYSIIQGKSEILEYL